MKIVIDINRVPVSAFLYGRAIMVNFSELQKLGIITTSFLPHTLDVGMVEYKFKERMTEGDPLTPTRWTFTCLTNVLHILNQ